MNGLMQIGYAITSNRHSDCKHGAKITVRWDTGGETSLFPGPGVLRVVEKPAPTKKPLTS